MDVVKFLKIENPAEGGTQTDYLPTETNPNQDYGSVKGLIFDAVSGNRIEGVSGNQLFYDTASGNTSGWNLSQLAQMIFGNRVYPGKPSDGDQLIWSTLDDRWNFSASSSGRGRTEYLFGFDGNASSGRFLESLTNVSTSYTGCVIATSLKILYFSAAIRVSGSITFVVYKNRNYVTPIATFNIASAVKNWGAFSPNVQLTAGDELAVKVSAGSGERPVVVLHMGE